MIHYICNYIFKLFTHSLSFLITFLLYINFFTKATSIGFITQVDRWQSVKLKLVPGFNGDSNDKRISTWSNQHKVGPGQDVPLGPFHRRRTFLDLRSTDICCDRRFWPEIQYIGGVDSLWRATNNCHAHPICNGMHSTSSAIHAVALYCRTIKHRACQRLILQASG